MEKRALLAIVLSIVVLILYQRFFLPQPPRKEGERGRTERTERVPAAPHLSEKEAYESPIRREKEGVVEKGATGEGKMLRDVTVETKLYSATFTNYGARLKSWRLHQYKNRVEYGPFVRWFQGTKMKVWRFFGFNAEPLPEGKPEWVELVSTEELQQLPLAIEVRDTGGVVSFAPMDIERDSMLLGGGGREGNLFFRGGSGRGLEISRAYRFFDDAYRVDMEVRIKNRGETPKEVRVALVWFGKMLRTGSRTFSGPVAMVDGKVSEIKEKKFKKEELWLSGDIQWFGSSMGEKNAPNRGQRKPFFVSLIVPKEKDGGKLGIGMEDEEVMYSRLVYPTRSIPGGGEAVYSYEIYLGPKVIGLLKGLNVGAEKVVRFGWFTAIAKVLLHFMNLTHKVTNNYGVDIIIISALLKILFWPLTKKSYVSMKEMQKIQPEMAMLRERYKDDKARLNREMMDLYKRRRVNPLGGCLPMVVQIPIFFALYWALMGSIELRHAPFILWIRDLSYRDPIYVSPILMGASMVWQQKMTPTAGDPRQAKMMMIMPVVFTFLFLNFPAGLVIYWLVTNLLTIGQQYLINKRLK